MLTALSSLVLTATLSFSPEAIYDEDNRHDVFNASEFHRELSLATAAMIHPGYVKDGGGLKNISTLKEDHQLCPGERFSQQPSVASCSGFLVAPDLIVTAGHCVSEEKCEGRKWVFDYRMEDADHHFAFPPSSIYNCKEVLGKRSFGVHMDAAVIRLDRPVLDRTPLKLSGRKAQSGDELVMIGHPSGLPTKVTDGALVRRRGVKRFLTNLDAFGGNSGSAVLDAKTGEVVGILVQGKNDYVKDGDCYRARVFTGKGGEWVSDISQVEGLW